MSISENYAKSLQAKFTAQVDADEVIAKAGDPNKFFYRGDQIFEVEAGQKFDRIVQQGVDSEGKPQQYSRSVHAFVERETGKLIKAAGWKAPAKRANGELQSKFNLSTPSGFKAALDAADRFGGYLYL